MRGGIGVFREVPVLPVVVPGAAAVFAVLLWSMHVRARLSAPRVAVAFALCVYAAGAVANTIFPIFLDAPGDTGHWFVAAVPLVDYEAGDALTNILVFVPLGMLVPLLVARPSWGRVLAAAALFSLTIEVTQLVTARYLQGGHIADVNDLLFNIVGGALGFGVLSALLRVPIAAGLVQRFRWR